MNDAGSRSGEQFVETPDGLDERNGKDLRRRALALLTRREHSRAELARKLAGYGPADHINQVLMELETTGLLSDARAAAALLRANGGRFGATRLRQELRRKGLDPAVLESADHDLADELTRAQAVWAKKFATPPQDRQEWARQARFLQGRGFSSEVIRQVVRLGLRQSGDPDMSDSDFGES